ncbi:MAG: hypothetical protein RL323_452 [Pseudomonadota bacterium]
MLYTESKEKSAELLRAALGLMNQNSAAFNPVTYTVWYEYAAGINAGLVQAIDRLHQSEPKLGDDSVQALYQQHIAGVDSATMERISQDFQQVMQGMAKSASDTGQHAGAFGAQLKDLTDALESQPSPQLQAALRQTLAQTQVMQDSAAQLQAQVAASKQEIDKLRADLDRAREESFVDNLTRVLNRKGLDHKFDTFFKQPMAEGETHGLVMLDIDHFKRINDGHGHLMGDRVLKALGEVLNATVTDPAHTVARYGGEEFAILLPNASLKEAAEVAERVRQRTKAMRLRNRTTNEVVLTVTVSAGVAQLSAGETAQDWIARADAALYRSKQEGRDRVSVAA